MLLVLADGWLALALRALVLLGFGALLVARPLGGGPALLWLFGAFALTEGLTNVAAGVHLRRWAARWWLLLLRGGLGAGVGLLTLRSPDRVLLAPVAWVGFWAMATGAVELASGFRLEGHGRREGLFVLFGGLAVAWGAAVLLRSSPTELSIVRPLSEYLLVMGTLLLGLALRLRVLSRRFRADYLRQLAAADLAR